MLRNVFSYLYGLAQPAPKLRPGFNAKGEPVAARLYILTDDRGRTVASR